MLGVSGDITSEQVMTVIAMTREIGSLGTDVATGVANELGLKLVHCEIATGAPNGFLQTEDSRLHINSTSSVLERWLINRHKLARYTSDEILRLAEQGNVLIRGWGAGALLRDVPHVSVRVCAPLDFRVRTAMERLGVRDTDAVRMDIERFDDAHSRALRRAYNIDRHDALLYDLVLNTERISVAACIDAVCMLARQPRRQERAGALAAGAGARPRDLVIAGIVTRLLASAKPFEMFDMAGSAGIGDVLGLAGVDEHELCAAIDWLRAACRVAEDTSASQFSSAVEALISYPALVNPTT